MSSFVKFIKASIFILKPKKFVCEEGTVQENKLTF